MSDQEAMYSRTIPYSVPPSKSLSYHHNVVHDPGRMVLCVS